MLDRAATLYDRLSLRGAAATDYVRSASIDALRATAALLVLAGHAYGMGGKGPPLEGAGYELARFGGSGVWLFFAVSGFLIGGPFLRSLLAGRPPSSVRHYALRRVVRIVPAYWIAFAVILVVATGSMLENWWQIPVHGLLVHSLVPGESTALFFVAWTLGVEVIFYALVPLAALLVARSMRGRPIGINALAAVIAGLWALSAIWGVVLAESSLSIRAQGVLAVGSYLGNFCPGLLVFLALTPQAAERGGPWALYRSVVAHPAAVLAVAVAIWVAHSRLTADSPLAVRELVPMMGVVSGLILAAVLHGARWMRRPVMLLAPVGLISYGVYLWHWVVLKALLRNDLVPIESFSLSVYPLQVLLLLAFALPLGLASWLLVERPLLRRT